MAHELKEGYDKFPPASRRLAQTIIPTDGAAGLLTVARGLQHLGAAAAGGSGDARLSPPPTVAP